MEQQKLPNTTVIVVLGIASILLCWCYGILGLILSIVALVLANKATNLYKQNPELYSDYGTVKTGKIIAIIGLVLSILMILLFAWVISIVGLDALQDEQLMRERIEEFFN